MRARELNNLVVYIRDELYVAVEPTGVVCFRACTPDQMPKSAIEDPMHTPIKFRISVWMYLALGMIGTLMTVMIGTRYPSVE
jgi:hypothetical protein